MYQTIHYYTIAITLQYYTKLYYYYTSTILVLVIGFQC